MIEIRYKDSLDLADIAGNTVAEARESFKKSFGITEKAFAFINGKKVSPANEADTILYDKDNLVFRLPNGRGLVYAAGALLLAMVITSGVFAYGFTNASVTLSATTSSNNFANVSANTSVSLSWTARGLQKNSTGAGTLFDISTASSSYSGDFIAVVMLANVDDLVKVYRNLGLEIEVRNSSGNLVDINSDGICNNQDVALLTLNNGSVSLFITQTAPTVYTVKVKSGYYACNAVKAGWSPTIASPQLYCEVAQR
jgi:hypothetical protein